MRPTNTPHPLTGLSVQDLMGIVGCLTVGTKVRVPAYNSTPAMNKETEAVVIAKSEDGLTALLHTGQTVSYHDGDSVTRIGFNRSVSLTRNVEGQYWRMVGRNMRKPKPGKVYLFVKGCTGRFPEVVVTDLEGNILPGLAQVLTNTTLEYVGPIGAVNGSLTQMTLYHTFRLTPDSLLRIKAGHPSESETAMVPLIV